jgi:hypothetical protein
VKTPSLTTYYLSISQHTSAAYVSIHRENFKLDKILPIRAVSPNTFMLYSCNGAAYLSACLFSSNKSRDSCHRFRDNLILVDLETWTRADAIAAVIVVWCAINSSNKRRDSSRAADLVDLETWTHADATAAAIVVWYAIKKRRRR